MRKLTAEYLGTLFLLATVVGSGIMAERLAGGNVAIALLGNTLPTGAILVVIILMMGPISGAHFNPAVTLVFVLKKVLSISEGVFYSAVQVAGGITGVLIAHIMFDHTLIEASSTARSGVGQYTGEFVATFGLIGTILCCLRSRPEAIPYAVGLYITAAYWFTSSTSFANPAVTISRAFSDTFAGIQPSHVPAFVIVQLVAAFISLQFFSWLLQEEK